MQVHLKIGEFAKLSGVTVKTILYYHKIGLLGEPVRSPAGYRLYGLEEAKHMRTIQRLKSLGLGLNEIKGILGCATEYKSAREVLLSLQADIVMQIKSLEDQLARIQTMLEKDQALLLEDQDESASFKMILDILGPDAQAQYQNSCPEMYEQERKIYSVIDELQWGLDYQDLLREMAAYFKEYPDQYQQALMYGSQMTAIADLPPDSPIIEDLARNYGCFIKSLPFFEKMTSPEMGITAPLESLWTEMFTEILGPAQMKLIELLWQYIMPDNLNKET